MGGLGTTFANEGVLEKVGTHLERGTRVELHGLASAPRLNGWIGKCLSVPTNDGRCAEELEKGPTVNRKLDNLNNLRETASKEAPTPPREPRAHSTDNICISKPEGALREKESHVPRSRSTFRPLAKPPALQQPSKIGRPPGSKDSRPRLKPGFGKVKRRHIAGQSPPKRGRPLGSKDAAPRVKRTMLMSLPRVWLEHKPEPPQVSISPSRVANGFRNPSAPPKQSVDAYSAASPGASASFTGSVKNKSTFLLFPMQVGCMRVDVSRLKEMAYDELSVACEEISLGKQRCLAALTKLNKLEMVDNQTVPVVPRKVPAASSIGTAPAVTASSAGSSLGAHPFASDEEVNTRKTTGETADAVGNTASESFRLFGTSTIRPKMLGTAASTFGAPAAPPFIARGAGTAPSTGSGRFASAALAGPFGVLKSSMTTMLPRTATSKIEVPATGTASSTGFSLRAAPLQGAACEEDGTREAASRDARDADEVRVRLGASPSSFRLLGTSKPKLGRVGSSESGMGGTKRPAGTPADLSRLERLKYPVRSLYQVRSDRDSCVDYVDGIEIVQSRLPFRTCNSDQSNDHKLRQSDSPSFELSAGAGSYASSADSESYVSKLLLTMPAANLLASQRLQEMKKAQLAALTIISDSAATICCAIDSVYSLSGVGSEPGGKSERIEKRSGPMLEEEDDGEGSYVPSEEEEDESEGDDSETETDDEDCVLTPTTPTDGDSDSPRESNGDYMHSR